MSVILEQKKGFEQGYEYGYGSTGVSDTDTDGKKEIDCSHLVNQILVNAGYKIPYETTSQLDNSIYFDVIDQSDAKSGDVILWRGDHNHTGILDTIRYSKSPPHFSGTFFGSQTSTGPATAKFGDGAPYWPKPKKILRPKEKYKTNKAVSVEKEIDHAIVVTSCCFPIVTESGEQYKTAEDVYKLLEKETSGFYLLSAHNFWHGGLHFTDASVPHHVNKQAIRCMMDGKVVAYRLNKDYLTSNWAGNTLQFSSSFCLVQHDYESPANSDEGSNKGKKNKLTFYSLYMHLAPYSVYANKDSQVAKKDQKNKLKIKQTIRVRKGEAATQSAPPVLGHLGIGSIVDLTGETAQFSVQEQSGSHSYRFVKGSVSEVQGKTDATVTKGAVIWVVDDSKYTEHVTPSSATPSEMKPPAYWQCKMKGIVKNRVNARAIKDNSKAFSEKNSEALGLLNITAEFEFETKEILTCQIGGKSHRIAKATLIKGGYADKAGQPPSPFWVCVDEPFVTLEAQPPTEFDEVIKLNNPIPIKAGDAIGYMGLYEVPKMPAASGLKTSKHQVHIEIFTTESDANVKAFLDNQAGLKSGKQYLKVKKDTCIYVRNEDKKKVSFATAGLKTCEDTVFELDVCKKEKDSNNAVYYKINQLPVPLNHKQDGYIGEKEAEILSQYDLSKLGFLMLEEKNTNSDGYLDPEKMPDFFQQLYKEIDTDGKNGVDSTEIAAAFRDKSKRDKLVKLVAKHPSEWHSLTINTIKQTLSSWSADNLEKETEELLEHEKARMEKLEWMSKLFSPMVWHFNPILFVHMIQPTGRELIWMKRVCALFGSAVAEKFRDKVILVGGELGIDPNYMMACFALETGTSFRTDIKNPNSSASGLIQFMNSTAKKLGTTTEKLRAMNHVEQMDYVKKYFSDISEQVNVPTNKWSLHDVYLAIFTPSAIKKKPDDVVYRSGQDAYSVNMYHDVDKDGLITKKEICSNIDVFYKKGMEFIG